MIVYFETSALVKRYLVEADSSGVEALWNQATRAVVSEILYDEMAAAFARKKLEVPAEVDSLDRAQNTFRTEWPSMRRIALADDIHQRVDDLLSRHPLRGSDAVHLASAISFRDFAKQQLTFACVDHALIGAARHEGFLVAP